MSESISPAGKSPSPVAAWAFGIFLLALSLRLIGIGWGLPNEHHQFSYHPDEPVVYAFSRQIEPAKGDFTPGFYNYGTLYLTIMRITGDVVATYTGGADPRDPASQSALMGRVHMAGRVLSALAGAGTCAVVFLLGARWFGLFGGVLAALALSFAPGHVVHSRFQTVDVLSVFLLTLALYYAQRIIPIEGEDPPVDKDITRWLILAGLFVGLSAGTKYTGMLGVFSIAVAAWVVHRPVAYRGVGFACLAAGVSFHLATPGVLLDSSAFWRDFYYEMEHTATGHGMVFAGTPTGFVFHGINFFVGLGTIVTLVGLLGLGLSALRRQPLALLLLAFFIPYYILIGRAEVKFLRYTFPLFPPIVLGLGWAMAEAHRRGGYSRAGVALGILGIGGVDTGGAIASARFTQWMAGQDPRDQAAEYLKDAAKADPEMTVGLASDPWFYSVPLFPLSEAPRWVPFQTRMEALDAATSPRVLFHRPVDSDPFAFDVRLLTEGRPTYVPISSFEYGDLRRLQGVSGLSELEQLQVDREKAFRSELTRSYELTRIFAPDTVFIHDLKYVRPTVELWKRKDSN